MGEGNPHPLLTILQIAIATMEIGVENSQKAQGASATGPSHPIPQHTPKGLQILLHRWCLGVVAVSLSIKARKSQPKWRRRGGGEGRGGRDLLQVQLPFIYI